ncbi:hypothetical protein OIU84_029104, partial [Salix udensis]
MKNRRSIAVNGEELVATTELVTSLCLIFTVWPWEVILQIHYLSCSIRITWTLVIMISMGVLSQVSLSPIPQQIKIPSLSSTGLIGKMTSLTNLQLSANQLEGGIPRSFGGMCSLRELVLSYNNLSGPLPRLDGNVSESIGSLSLLEELSAEGNSLQGVRYLWFGNFRDNPQL